MAKHRTRVGIHARNSVQFTNHDFELVRLARIETLKMMSHTDIGVYERLRRENPKIEFIVRLYDDRLRYDSRPSPADFVAKMVPIIKRLRPYVRKFEIHNEPNHVDGVEGWGSSDQQARSFRNWYMQVLPALKKACGWAKFGFPGLALNYPHRDLEWLDICRNAIRVSDWLGCHCYWQYGNMMKDEWGLRFKLYHERFPGKKIEITEFGDSTPNRPRQEIATQYVQYYQELNKYPYLRSASAFIASSPDPTWNLFVWMKEGGEMLPVVRAVGSMKRVAVEAVQPSSTTGTPDLAGRTFSQTGKTVRGSFLEFFDQHGLDICGYPITDQIEEAGLQAQYFQRIALEESQPGQLRLKLVGTEAWGSRQKLADLEARLEALRSRPSAAGLIKPFVQDLVDELPKHASNRYPSRSLTDINQIVIHHTATSPTITPQRLAEYQVKSLKKPGITYHFVVAADGEVYQTNRLETVSDHAFGRNQESIGVCFAGNFTNAIPTTAQLQAGGELCAWLLSHVQLPTDKIVGLGEFVNTQSPGKQWLRGQRWKEKLLAEVESVMEAAAGEDQSILIASLREQIEALESEIERLRQESSAGGEPGAAPIQTAVDRLSDTTLSLQSQVNVLRAERVKLEAIEKASETDQSALITSLQKRIGDLQKEKEDLQADMESALKAKGNEQANLIASLRRQISSLQNEIRRLQDLSPDQPTIPVVEPGSGISVPPIQNMIDKLPTHKTKRYGNRPRSDIKTLVIHHSAVPPTVGPQRIADYHVKSLDWPGVGYHFIVADDGVVYQSNAVTTVSFHAAKVNPRGVGVCFLGNFTKEVPPPAQLQAGAHLVAWLMQELDLELDMIKGHQEFMSTACPGNQWLRGKKWKQMLRQEVTKVQQDGALTGWPSTAVPGAKPIYHYVLFWHHGDSWAQKDWVSAQDYIAAFQPTVGFSSQDASQAENVTIVGGPLGVPQNVEDWLIAQGCRVDRIAGANEAATKQMLTNLINKGKRFRSFDG